MNPAMIIAAAVTGAILVLASVDVVLTPPDDVTAEPRPVPAQTTGTWYCAVGDTSAGTSLEFTGTAVAARRSGSWIRLETFADGSASTIDEEVRIVRGQVQHWTPPAGTAEMGTVASWRDGPALLARTWRRGVLGEPAGIVHGPCESEPSTSWFAPGMTTIGGSVARVVIANPFDTDAAVSIELFGQAGRETPELLKNVGVPARSARTIVLNDHVPEREHVGAEVTVRAGRVVAEAWQSVDPVVGGVAGVGLVKLARTSAERWTVPWLPGGSSESWLWVANPEDRQAELSVVAHGGAEALATSAPGEISVPPGSAARIAVSDLLPEGATSAGFTVSSENGVPVVVGSATRVTSGDVDRTGFAVQLGHADLSRFWAVPASAATGRGAVLHVANPAAREAEIEVRIAADVGLLSPPELASIVVPAGGTAQVDLGPFVGELSEHTVIVEATRGAIVASIHSYERRGRLALVIHRGVPNQVWSPAGPLANVERDGSLSRRIGTSAGPATERTEPGDPATDVEPEMEGGG